MPEQMNVEIAHKLIEREQVAKENRRWEEVIEILGSRCSPWPPSPQHGADTRPPRETASSRCCTRMRASTESRPTAATLGQQRLAADGSMFSAWLEARAANNPRLQAMLVRRFSPEYRTAFVAWLETEPSLTRTRPRASGYLPEYRNPQMEQATS